MWVTGVTEGDESENGPRRVILKKITTINIPDKNWWKRLTHKFKRVYKFQIKTYKESEFHNGESSLIGNHVSQEDINSADRKYLSTQMNLLSQWSPKHPEDVLWN